MRIIIGDHTKRNNEKVMCRACKGTGIWKIVICKTRHGLGHITKEVPITFERCYNCKGTGKVEVNPFNPVIKKGAVL